MPFTSPDLLGSMKLTEVADCSTSWTLALRPRLPGPSPTAPLQPYSPGPSASPLPFG